MPEHAVNKAIHRLEYVNPLDPQEYQTRDILHAVTELLAGLNPALPLNGDVQRDLALAHSALMRAHRRAEQDAAALDAALTKASEALHIFPEQRRADVRGWLSVQS